MMAKWLGALGALPLLAGCVLLAPTPPQAEQVKIMRVSSPVVEVERSRIIRDKGQLVLFGQASKQLGAQDTSRTHLEVTLFDTNGAVLRKSVEHFSPAQIPWGGHRMHGHSQIRIVLDPLPPSTAVIEVRADETTH